LEELGLEQRDLARAARVTESYISQLLTRKKAPPAPSRTDIYDRMDKFLKLPSGELAKLAELQRKAQLKRELGDEPVPLFHEVRELILRKCNPDRAPHVRAIFEQQPFGELERLVTQKLLDVVKRVAKDELENDYWLRMVAQLSGKSYEEMRVTVLEFLDTDIFHLSAENCTSFLDPLIESWDIDLATFGLEITLNHTVVPGQAKRFAFVEQDPAQPVGAEPGLRKFLQDPSLSGTATPEELEFLKRLKFTHKRPTPLYYYRELQSLRDPLHFDAPGHTHDGRGERPAT
jgi:transcriptional regulator with XRE-family HTH domain